MDALVMCGGRGTRLDAAVEKPLVDVCGTPMVDRVVDALRDSRVDAVHAVVSPHAPDTRTHARERVPVVDAPGEGYVSDLGFALDRVAPPVVTVAADLPLLRGDHVNAALDAADGSSLTVCVPASLKRELGTSLDESLVFDYRGTDVCPTGLGVVGPGPATTDTDPTVYLTTDTRLALNVNRPEDVALAEDRCE